MVNGRDEKQIKRIRNEVLVALRVLYPGAMQADPLLRSLLMLFPEVEFHHFRRDLAYLIEKGYVERIVPDADHRIEAAATPWRRRWFKLTPAGLEIADRCVRDPALDESGGNPS
jgi:hypothetical protein